MHFKPRCCRGPFFAMIILVFDDTGSLIEQEYFNMNTGENKKSPPAVAGAHDDRNGLLFNGLDYHLLT